MKEYKSIYYYDILGIINDNIANLIFELFNFELKKGKFLFGNDKFIMNLNLEKHNSVFMGHLVKNNIFETQILFDFEKK